MFDEISLMEAMGCIDDKKLEKYFKTKRLLSRKGFKKKKVWSRGRLTDEARRAMGLYDTKDKPRRIFDTISQILLWVFAYAVTVFCMVPTCVLFIAIFPSFFMYGLFPSPDILMIINMAVIALDILAIVAISLVTWIKFRRSVLMKVILAAFMSFPVFQAFWILFIFWSGLFYIG